MAVYICSPVCPLGMHGVGELYVYCLFLNLLLVRTLPEIFCPWENLSENTFGVLDTSM